MFYQNIKPAQFLSRPNRFVAEILLEGKVQIAHVKNTGRCRELLLPHAKILLEEFPPSSRKTNYDLVAVYKGDRLINMDSQAPNPVFAQWVEQGNFLPDVLQIRREYTYQDSRLDFYLETPQDKILVEVKGVTLEENGVCLFPDAPTQRGVKHLHTLASAVKEGYRCFAVFILQMEGAISFSPNEKTHPAFAVALQEAATAGVTLLAYDCTVTENSLAIRRPIPIVL